MQGFKGPGDSIDRKLSNSTLRQIETLVSTFREAIGADTNLILDTNMHFRSDGNLRLASVLEPYYLTWLEVDSDNPNTLRHLRDKVSIPIGSCEKCQGVDEYLPYFMSLSMDVAIIDVRWNGILQSKKVADLAQVFEINMAPHNHGSPLSTMMTAHFCAIVTNLLFMEYDLDDVPWRNEIVTYPPDIKDGYLYLNDKPGWGTDLDEELIRFHAA
jgi:L-alanine-DL-glutamate epimerase-like enolase superfamily enzyme